MTIPATEAEVRALAEGLSEAQRRCILAMSAEWKRAKAFRAAAVTLHSLWDYQRRNLSAPVQLVTRDYSDFPLCYVWRLTPLGILVRATLTGDPS